MKLICDYREKPAVKRLLYISNQYCQSKSISNESCNFVKNIVSESLPLGDFAFGNVIIERKTHQDLASSIVDGRYKEQCERLSTLKEHNQNIKVIYIIEGNFDLYFNSFGNIDKDKLYSAIITLIYEKNFSVILTKHLNETCDILFKFYTKYCAKYYRTIQDNESTLNESSQVSLQEGTEGHFNVQNLIKQQNKKNSQITRDNIGIIMLCNIPNISYNISVSLLKPFDFDIYRFIHAVRNNPEFLNEVLIECKSNNNKKRKLGKNVKDTLIDFLSIKSNATDIILSEV